MALKSSDEIVVIGKRKWREVAKARDGDNLFDVDIDKAKTDTRYRYTGMYSLNGECVHGYEIT